jgi:L-fuconolactonase
VRIDSHHHFWKYSAQEYGWITSEMAVLQRDYFPADLDAELKPAGIDAAITVQASQTVSETRWLLELAESHPQIAGVVGWVPLAEPHVRRDLESLAQNRWLKGVRHVIQDEPDDQFILGDAFNAGVSLLAEFGLVYDILIYAKHLVAATRFVDRHPNQVFVLDHLAKPTIAADRFDDAWRKNLQTLAQRQNVFCKFSGITTEIRDDCWDLATIQPYWDVALEAFGPDRLMFGSDWPVCLLKTDYSRWVKTVAALTHPLSVAEQRGIWGENAAKVYRLSLAH